MNTYNYTIIIPHKNIPDLLQRCLNSIPEREDLQIIIADDNSDPEIVDFSSFPGQNRKNVEILFSKTGRGAGFARNLGLQVVKGKWVLFADADDFFNNCLNEVLDEYADEPADIVCFKNNSIHNVSNEELKKGDWLNKFIDIYLANSRKGEKLLRYLFVVSWCKLIKKNLISKYSIKYDETIVNNDITFSYLTGFYANSIKADSRELYCWVYRENSISQQKNEPAIILDKIYVYAKAIIFYKKLRQGIRLKKMWLEIFFYLRLLYLNDRLLFLKAKNKLLDTGFTNIEIFLGMIILLIININVHRETVYVTADTTISDVINNPVFAGFGQFIFPIKNRSSSDPKKICLSNISSLLLYHSSIDTNTTIDVINYMLDEVNNDRKIFYDFYTNSQKRNDPSKKSTGLFFFRGKRGAPFAVICAGGGFKYVGSIHESFPLAIELSKKGYNAFAIEYRIDDTLDDPCRKRIATDDLAAAISYIFNNAETLGVSTNSYSVWGSSAGAKMAAAIDSYSHVNSGGVNIPIPSIVVIAYTGHFGSTQNYPPTFAIISENDTIVCQSKWDQSVENIKNAGIDIEYHKYKRAGHGFGLGIGTEAEGWINNAIRFWEKNISKYSPESV